MPPRSITFVGLVLLVITVMALAYVNLRPDGEPSARDVAAEGSIPDAPGPYLDIVAEGVANGTITIDLNETVAPEHAARLIALAREGAYDGVVFHRVIDGFMAQTGDVRYGRAEGGDLARAGTGGSDRPDLAAEFSDLQFQRGVVGMARSRRPDSANSQFFIMFRAAPHLHGKYTVVGRVTEGMEVVDAIKRGSGRNGAVTTRPDVMREVTVRP